MSIAPEFLNPVSTQPLSGSGIGRSAWRGARDDLFFSAMVILMIAIVFLGFARTYYLAGVFHTHVRSVLIEIHGAVFTAWMLLLVAQTALVSRRQIAIHRKLGVFGACLAAAMVGLGVAAATDSLSRGMTPPGFPFGPLSFYAIPMITIFTFAILAAAAICMRANGPAHKRLILLATISLMGPAISRWPFAIFTKSPIMTNLLLDLLVLLLVAFDFSTLRRIHRATLLGGLFFMVLSHMIVPIGITPAWRSFAALASRAWRGLP